MQLLTTMINDTIITTGELYLGIKNLNTKQITRIDRKPLSNSFLLDVKTTIFNIKQKSFLFESHSPYSFNIRLDIDSTDSIFQSNVMRPKIVFITPISFF